MTQQGSSMNWSWHGRFGGSLAWYIRTNGAGTRSRTW
jgi:hypothetical protein